MNVKELGKQKKRENPGKYNHLTDIQVGRALKARHPWKYRKVEDVYEEETTEDALKDSPITPEIVRPGTSVTRMDQAQGVMQQYSLGNVSHTEELLEKVKSHYDPSKGRLKSLFSDWQAKARLSLAMTINEEQVAVIRQGALLEDSLLTSRKARAEYEIFLKNNALLLHNLMLSAELAERAFKEGLTLPSHQDLLVTQAKSDIVIDEEKKKSTIRTEEHERKTKIDLDARMTEIKQDLDAGDDFIISEQSILEKLTNRLITARRERYAIEVGNDPEPLKQHLLKDYDDYIKRVKRLKDERSTGQKSKTRPDKAQDRKEPRRKAKGTPDGRAGYPPEDPNNPD